MKTVTSVLATLLASDNNSYDFVSPAEKDIFGQHVLNLYTVTTFIIRYNNNF